MEWEVYPSGARRGGIIRFHRRGVVFFDHDSALRSSLGPARVGTVQVVTHVRAMERSWGEQGIASLRGIRQEISILAQEAWITRASGSACLVQVHAHIGYSGTTATGVMQCCIALPFPGHRQVRVGTGWNAGPGNSPAAAVLCDWLVSLYRVFVAPRLMFGWDPMNVRLGGEARATGIAGSYSFRGCTTKAATGGKCSPFLRGSMAHS